MADTERRALIVGASRGLGLGLVQRHLERGWSIVATVRSRAEALDALHCDRLRIETLDMTEPAAIDALADRLGDGAFQLVFVNAGITGGRSGTAADADDAGFAQVMLTNAVSPLRVIERFKRLVPAGGIVAAMSSSLGSIANNETGGSEVYRASKAALNMLLRSAAARDRKSGRVYLAVDPGWVRTDMGGANAPLDVETSTRGIADLIETRLDQGDHPDRGRCRFVTYQDRELPW